MKKSGMGSPVEPAPYRFRYRLARTVSNCGTDPCIHVSKTVPKLDTRIGTTGIPVSVPIPVTGLESVRRLCGCVAMGVQALEPTQNITSWILLDKERVGWKAPYTSPHRETAKQPFQTPPSPPLEGLSTHGDKHLHPMRRADTLIHQGTLPPSSSSLLKGLSTHGDKHLHP